MGRKEIELEAERLLEPALKQLGIELIDVEYVRERNWILRVFIDKEGGVDLNDCQQISEKAGELLDEADLISANYMLEVSSPGLDVKLFAPLEEVGGVKAFTAVLDGLSDDGQIMLIFQDKPITLGKDKISQIRIHFSF